MNRSDISSSYGFQIQDFCLISVIVEVKTIENAGAFTGFSFCGDMKAGFVDHVYQTLELGIELDKHLRIIMRVDFGFLVLKETDVQICFPHSSLVC